MKEFKCWVKYLGRELGVWAKWVHPTSSFVAKASLIITVLGGLFWLLGKMFTKSTTFTDISNNVGFWGFWVGVGISVAMLIFWAPYKINKDDKAKWTESISKLNFRISELEPLEKYKLVDQVGHEQDWLHFNIEYVDLVKRNYFSENEIYVKYNFVSGLVYDFKPYRMWISPTFNGYESPEPQKEIIPPDNFLRGKRSQTSNGLIISINDQKLLEILKDVRKAGTQVKKGLKIQMQIRDGDSIQVFKDELS